MRKGYIVIEMVIVIAITVTLMAPIYRLFRVILYKLPKDSRLVQENVVLLDAVRHIRCDVASAKSVSQKTDDSSETSLVIQQADGVIYYKLQQGRIIRQKQDGVPAEIIWSIPHGKVETRVRSENQRSYAVELITFIEDTDLGHTGKKMANNYLFFTGMPSEAAK